VVEAIAESDLIAHASLHEQGASIIGGKEARHPILFASNSPPPASSGFDPSRPPSVVGVHDAIPAMRKFGER
jgi:hypothetical protein